MCDIVIYREQHRQLSGEEVLTDLSLVQSVRVKTLGSVLAPSSCSFLSNAPFLANFVSFIMWKR